MRLLDNAVGRVLALITAMALLTLVWDYIRGECG